MKKYIKIFSSIFILFNFSANAQQFTFVNTDIIPAPDGEVQWGDFDNDGDLDILISGYPHGDVSLLIPGSPAFIYRNDGNNKFTNINAPLDSSYHVEWIDVNNDNYLDVFLSDAKAIYLNLNGSFQKVSLPVSNSIISYCWGDYDRDGDNDLLLSIVNTEYLIIFKNDGGQFQRVTTNIPNLENSRICFEDYNGDGYPDIFFAGYTNKGALLSEIFKNDGNGNFVVAVSDLPFVPLAWSDMNNDGRIDALGINLEGKDNILGVEGLWVNEAEVYLNEGEGKFTLSGSKILFYYTYTLDTINVKLGDVDNDGDMDVLIGSSPNFGLYINDGNNNFVAPDSNYWWNSSGDMDLGDYDNDGDLDIIWAQEGQLWRNNSLLKNLSPAKITFPSSFVNSGNVQLTWSLGSDDHTNSKALTYNVRISTTPGGVDILSPMSDPVTGKRYVSVNGNAGTNNFYKLDNLKNKGTYYWSVQAVDGGYAGSPFSDEKSFVITNTNPEITSSPVTRLIVDSTYYYKVTADDKDGDTVSYSMETGASFLSMNNLTGEITGKAGISDTGKFNVKVIANDGKGGTTEQTYSLKVVHRNPYFISNPNILAVADSFYRYQPVAADSDNDIVNTYYLITNADFLSIDKNTGLITGSPKISDYHKKFNVEVQVFDKYGGEGTQSYTLYVVKSKKIISLKTGNKWFYKYKTVDYKVNGYSALYDTTITNGIIIRTVIDDTPTSAENIKEIKVEKLLPGNKLETNKEYWYADSLVFGRTTSNQNLAFQVGQNISIFPFFIDTLFVDSNWTPPFPYNLFGVKQDTVSIFSENLPLQTWYYQSSQFQNEYYTEDRTVKGIGPSLFYSNYSQVGYSGYSSSTLIGALLDGKLYGDSVSIPVDLAPSAPKLTAIAGNNFIKLKWNKFQDSDFKMYNIFETNNSEDSLLYSITDINDTTLVLNGLTNGKAYYFKINSVDLNGNTSDFSEVVGVTPVLYTQSSKLTGTFAPDFDNNGFNDILSSDGSNYELYKNNEGMFLKSEFNFPGLSQGSTSWADYNNDGFYDFFYTGENNNDYHAYSKILKNISGNFEDVNGNIIGVIGSSIDWADYDNDGDLDFIVTGDPTDPLAESDPNLPTVRITKLYRNDGNDVFTEVNSDFPGILLGSAVWGDYDNDGDQDLLLCGLDFIKIYENVKGSFKEVISYKGYDNKGAWGDFNNDGLLDFCVVTADTFNYNENNAYLKIFYNNGYKSFNSVTISSSLYYWDVTCRDYDNDGDIDIILPYGNVVYQNNDGNNFERVSLPSASSFADYDNDGDLDIMGQNGIYRNNKIFNQNFNVKKNINPPVNLQATFLHDHSVKFSWSKPGNNSSQILTYNIRLGTKPNGIGIVSPMSNLVTGKRLKPAIGNAGFDTSWTIKNLPEGTYYWSIQSVDNNFNASVFSNEQKITVSYSFIAPHLVAVSGNELIQLKWNKYRFNDFKMYNIYETNFKKDSLLCSIKNINDTTLFIDRLKNGQQYYFKINSIDLNNDTSSFSEVVEVTPNLYKKLSGSIGLFTPDVDNNGFNDLLLLEGKIPDLKYSLYRNDSGLFQKTGFDFPQLNEGSISWADYNNDGLYDLIYSGLSNDDNKYTRILKNTNTNFNDINAAIMGIDFSSIDWADYDNDGDLDFILTGSNNDHDNSVTKLYRNDGNNIFTEMKIDFDGILKGSVSWGDFDNDGDQDLLLCGLNFIKIYENVDGNFKEENNFEGYSNKGIWGDFNNDGLLDFCTFSADTIYDKLSNGDLLIYKNNGDKSFSKIKIASSITFSDSASWYSAFPFVYCRDYDNDGDLDIILPDEGIIFKNNGNLNFQKMHLSSSFSFADYDNDGDLDVMGNSGLLRNNTIFNESFNTKKKLNPPVNLSAEILSDHSVKFSWNIPELNDTSKVFSYNLRIGTTVQGVDILSPMSNVITGKRLKPAIGNAGFDTSWTINNLPEGTYYWSVQSVDNNFDASVFADEQKIKVDYSKFEIPTQFFLYQNYPNPFNSRTTIRYDIPVDQYVTIKVYDITGSEVKTLVHKNQKAGRYTINFDSGLYASGVYFYRIITGKFNKVLKMILLK